MKNEAEYEFSSEELGRSHIYLHSGTFLDILDYNINLNPNFNWYFLSERVLWRAREKCTDSGLAGQICAVKRLHKEQTGRSDANLGNKVPYSKELSTNLREVSQCPEKALSSPCWKRLLALSQLRIY